MVNLFESLNVRPTKKAMLLVFQLLFSFFSGGGGNVQGSKIFEYIWKTGWPPNKHEAHISQRVSCGPLIIAARTSTRARNATACRWGCWWVWSARATFQNLNSKVWSTRTTKKEFLQTLCNSLPSHCKIAAGWYGEITLNKKTKCHLNLQEKQTSYEIVWFEIYFFWKVGHPSVHIRFFYIPTSRCSPMNSYKFHY